jgi:hypothetical protein
MKHNTRYTFSKHVNHTGAVYNSERQRSFFQVGAAIEHPWWGAVKNRRTSRPSMAAPFAGEVLTLTSATKTQPQALQPCAGRCLRCKFGQDVEAYLCCPKASNRILNYLPRVVVHVDVILTICRVRRSRYFVGTQSLAGEPLASEPWE